MSAHTTIDTNWRLALRSLRQPYRASGWMIVLMALVPLYIFIAKDVAGGVLHIPSTPLDRAIPFVPEWGLVYGALYIVLILLPVLVVREDAHLRRMFLTYVSVWVAAYACFLLYPTTAPRPAKVTGEGFAIWGLQFLYSSDPPYNCFPSLHVAHSVVSALMCHRINRRVGFIAFTCAALVAVSTLFTKQHYVLDVVAGALMACAAYLFFFRDVSRERITEAERLLAPIFATAVLAVAGVGLAAFWIVYQLR